MQAVGVETPPRSTSAADAEQRPLWHTVTTGRPAVEHVEAVVELVLGDVNGAVDATRRPLDRRQPGATPAGQDGAVDAHVAPDGSHAAVYLRLPAEPALSMVRSALRPGATVLELGSGPGRLTRPLAASGHPVVAVDESVEMLAHVTGADTVVADVWALDLGRCFDAVLATAHLFDQPSRERQRTLLEVCSRHLADGGVVVLERYPPDWTPSETAGLLGDVGVRLHDVRCSGPTFSAAVTYTVDGRRYTQRFTSRVTSDVELVEVAAEAGLRVDRWLDERHSWALLVGSSTSEGIRGPAPVGTRRGMRDDPTDDDPERQTVTGLGGMQAATDAGTTPSAAGAEPTSGGAGRAPDDIGPPGSQGAGLGGPMDTGPDAGAGPGVPQDLDAATAAIVEGRRSGGPAGSQDSGAGDLAEAGD